MFDTGGTLTHVTWTVVGLTTDTYTIDKYATQSGPVDCFTCGVVCTGKKG